MLEPGRYLVGEAGIYVARVIDIKMSRGKKFLILDGGMNHHLAASGNLGQVIKRNFPIAVLNKMGAEHKPKRLMLSALLYSPRCSCEERLIFPVGSWRSGWRISIRCLRSNR